MTSGGCPAFQVLAPQTSVNHATRGLPECVHHYKFTSVVEIGILDGVTQSLNLVSPVINYSGPVL